MMLEDYFNEQMSGKAGDIKIEFETGAKIHGTVIAIDKKSVFLDINSKSEGIVNREEFVDKEGNLTVNIGDKVDAYFVSDKDGEITLTVKMGGKFVAGHMEDAYRTGIPVEGKVAEEKKGGYLVKMSGKDAFCPYSQIDLFPRDPASYIGNSYSFVITEMNKFNTVLSRRRLLEKEKVKRIEYFKETLKEGDLITGTVINVKDFGVFVDLDSCEGFIPISELTWGRIENPSEILKPGDRVKVAVKKLDWENNKITLSYRSAQTSWDDIADRYPRGKLISAKVTRLANFGAFVELEKGIEGLIHISKIDPGRKISHPRESLTVGDVVSVVIEDVDKESQRISLARDFSGEIPLSEGETVYEEGAMEVGNKFEGTVEAVKLFGLFVRISPLEKGLLHISQIRGAGNIADLSLKILDKKYPVGSKINVMIREITDDGKISLALAEHSEGVEETEWKDFKRSKPESSQFGTSLADAFNKLDI